MTHERLRQALEVARTALKLLGGDGRDRLWGSFGNDQLDGGPGNDLCFGGPGRDTRSNC